MHPGFPGDCGPFDRNQVLQPVPRWDKSSAMISSMVPGISCLDVQELRKALAPAEPFLPSMRDGDTIGGWVFPKSFPWRHG